MSDHLDMRTHIHSDPTDPRSVAEGIFDAMSEPDGWDDPDLLWGAPVVDFTVTLLSLRAGMLGAASGRTLFHHELRRRLPFAPEAWPEVEVWEEEAELAPYWVDGILREPKYFSFFQDGPFAAFNPNYRRKWRAHEMLHGAVGWFWRRDMTRFEFYLASRINELLPVVHWYGFDEAFRPRCDEHFETVLAREYCQACEDAARHYWLDPDESRLDAATSHIARGLEHLHQELDVISHELESLQPISSPRGHLDGSSDAIGYLRGHWNRCTSWSFGAWVEGFLVGDDYFIDIASMLEHTADLARRLLSGAVSYDEDSIAHERARRHIQDIAYRCLLRIEADESAIYEAAIDPHLHRLADLAWDLAQGAAGPEAIKAPIENLQHTLEELTDFSVLARGFDASEPDSLDLLRQGVGTALPQTVESTDNLEYRISEFAQSAHFYTGGRLGDRFASWLVEEEVETAIIALFEAWVAAEPRRDEDYENFGHRPEALDHLREGVLRLNATYREMELDADQANLLFELDQDCTICRVFAGGEASVLVLEESSKEAIEAMRKGDVDTFLNQRNPVMLSLLEAGIVIWIPPARSQ